MKRTTCKIFSDASYDHLTGKCGYGVAIVMKDLCIFKYGSIRGAKSSCEAEVLAAKKGLDYLKTKEWICFLKNKTLLHLDYLIDDNHWNFIGSNVKHGILITAPYNVDIDTADLIKETNCQTLTRFESLEDFAMWYINNQDE